MEHLRSQVEEWSDDIDSEPDDASIVVDMLAKAQPIEKTCLEATKEYLRAHAANYRARIGTRCMVLFDSHRNVVGRTGRKRRNGQRHDATGHSRVKRTPNRSNAKPFSRRLSPYPQFRDGRAASRQSSGQMRQRRSPPPAAACSVRRRLISREFPARTLFLPTRVASAT